MKQWGRTYTGSRSQARIAEILTVEEESFIRTLKRGGNILNSVIEQAQKSAQKQITGEEAFKLKDTYGFPLEEILLIAKDTAFVSKTLIKFLRNYGSKRALAQRLEPSVPRSGREPL